MSRWSPEVFADLDRLDDLRVAPFRPDGVTPGTPTWIWAVVVDGRLYVRPYNGARSRWYQAAAAQRAGQVTVAGVTHEVAFEPAAAGVLDVVDDAYRVTYAGSPYLPRMIAARTRETTLEILPRASD
jgi:hypothetical protein